MAAQTCIRPHLIFLFLGQSLSRNKHRSIAGLGSYGMWPCLLTSLSPRPAPRQEHTQATPSETAPKLGKTKLESLACAPRVPQTQGIPAPGPSWLLTIQGLLCPSELSPYHQQAFPPGRHPGPLQGRICGSQSPAEPAAPHRWASPSLLEPPLPGSRPQHSCPTVSHCQSPSFACLLIQRPVPQRLSGEVDPNDPPKQGLPWQPRHSHLSPPHSATLSLLCRLLPGLHPKSWVLPPARTS